MAQKISRLYTINYGEYIISRGSKESCEMDSLKEEVDGPGVTWTVSHIE